MTSSDTRRVFRCAVLSVVKHAYLPRAFADHPRFEIVVVADDAAVPEWAHERNEEHAREFGVPYVRDVEKAVKDYDVDVAIVSSEAERHCDLSARAAAAGLHVVQDKPLSTVWSECERLRETVDGAGVRFLLWNRNFLPALIHAREIIQSGTIGSIESVHVDFYFSKDAGPPKGTRGPNDPPINWLERQLEAHADGSDGGVGVQPMGELEIEGIYPLGYIRVLTGADVKRVYARTASHFHQANADNHVDDLATVSLELERGIVGTLAIGRIGAAAHPEIGEIKLRILGSEGGLVISEARPEVAIYYRDQPAAEYPHIRVANNNDRLLVDDFARAIDDGTETILDIGASCSIARTVFAALESARTGLPVEV